jgi:hypothetical protein
VTRTEGFDIALKTGIPKLALEHGGITAPNRYGSRVQVIVVENAQFHLGDFIYGKNIGRMRP